MVTTEQIPTLIQSTAYDPSGDKIGAIKQVYLDDRTDQPQFATVHTGLFGLKESFVPLEGAQLQGDRVIVPVDKAQVKDAPNIDPDGSDGSLTPTQVSELYSHYNLGSAPSGTRDTYAADVDRETTTRGTRRSDGTYSSDDTYPAGETYGTTQRHEGGHHHHDHDRDRGRSDDAMTRSEERLNVGTETHEAGRARLRKYVETENVQQTVPVSRERVRVEREPISEHNRDQAFSGPAISEAEHEVTLHEERPVVEKEAVPVERVRLGKETVTDEQTINEQVRKERIDTDGIDERR